MSAQRHIWKGRDRKSIERMKKLFELEAMIFRKQQARDGVGLNPLRLLNDDIQRKKTSKEKERGWINSYKGDPKPKVQSGFMDKLILGEKILFMGADSPQTFFSSLNNSSKQNNDVKMLGRERGWSTTTSKKHGITESLYALSKPNQNYSQHRDQQQKMRKQEENAKRLETGWVSYESRARTGPTGTIGRPRGLTVSALQALQKQKTEKLLGRASSSTEGATTDRSPSVTTFSSARNSRASLNIENQDQKGYRGAIPSVRTSLSAPDQRSTFSLNLIDNINSLQQLLLQQGPKKTDEDILKQGIQKEEETAWMSSYKRKQKREIYGLAKQLDKTADQVLQESYHKYREIGWINPLQRSKPRVSRGLSTNRDLRHSS